MPVRRFHSDDVLHHDFVPVCMPPLLMAANAGRFNDSAAAAVSFTTILFPSFIMITECGVHIACETPMTRKTMREGAAWGKGIWRGGFSTRKGMRGEGLGGVFGVTIEN